MRQLRIAHNDTMILDATPYVLDASFATNEHGVEHISFRTEQHPTANLRLFSQDPVYEVGLYGDGHALAVGRLEDPGIIIGQENSYSAKALGYWRAFSDIPYTAMWNMTDYSQFREVTALEIASRTPEKYQTDTNGRLYMAPRKGETFVFPNDCSLNYTVPSGTNRLIVGVQFDWVVRYPTGWTCRCVAHNLWDQAADVLFSVIGNGATQSGSAWYSFTGKQALYFDTYRSGATATYSGETGDAYYRITNLRIVTSITNSIQTTLTANASAGSNVTLSVASTAGMYVGQELLIGATTSAMERVRITAINSATSITVASLAANRSSGNLVRAHKITPDQIIRDCVNIVATANPNHLIADFSQIQTINRDLADMVVYEDANMADITTDLAAKGDGTQSYEVGVDNGKRCYLRPKYSASRTWYVYVDELTLERSVESLYNSAYSRYQGSRNETLRTASATDSESATRYGVVRRQAITSDTQSAIIATAERDSAIANGKTVKPRAQFPISRIFSQAGVPADPCEIKAGDLFILQNLPVTGELNTVAQLRLSRTEVDLVSGVLTVEPELPLPTVDVQLAR